MAQTIKLRRSSTEGKVPTTSQLSLGEIAINTYDGRVFFEKNDGSATIQHIVTTDSITTGSVSIVGQLTVDDITLNGSTISDSGDLTLDIGGDLNIDVDGTDIILKDGGTAFGRFKRDSSDFIIKSEANNEDIIFRGQDAGATIDALTLDMSDAGTAIFNHDAKIEGGRLKLGTTSAGGIIENVDQSGTNQDGQALQIYGGRSTGTGEGGDISFFVSPKGATGSSLNDWYRVLHLEGASTATVEVRGELNLYSASNQASETTALVINGSGLVGSRELGSNAFNSTSFGTGSVTNVTVGTGLDVSTATTVPNITLDLSEFTDMTGGVNGSQDELILLDNGAERRKAINEIDLGQFDNSSAGFISEFDITTQTDPKYLRSNATDTATGALTFTGDSKFTGQTNFQIMGDNKAIFISSSNSYNPYEDTGLLYIGGYQNGNTATAGIIIDYQEPAVKLESDLKTSYKIEISDTTQSTSKTTGALTVSGGAGIAGDLNIGTSLTVDDSTNGGDGLAFSGDTLTLGNSVNSGANGRIQLKEEDNGSTATIINGNNSFRLYRSNLSNALAHDGTNWQVESSTQSTSKITGALIVDGGVGIAKTLNVGEDVVAYASSDERYKDNIKPIENPNEKLKQIGGYTFDWNDKHEVFKGQHDVGVIAQEIEKVLPEIVETRENGYKAVKYEKIVSLLIESNKELIKRVEELESKIK